MIVVTAACDIHRRQDMRLSLPMAGCNAARVVTLRV